VVLNKALKTLFLYNGIFVFAHGLIGPLYALFLESIGQKIFAVSVSWAAYLLSTTVCMIFIAKYGDKVKNKGYLLVASFLLRAIAWTGFIFANSLTTLILIQILAGICEGLGVPAFNTIFADHLDKSGHIREYSDWHIIANVIVAISTLLAGAIASIFGFKILFMMMITLSLVCFFGTALNVKYFENK
jgi:MFS family permease